MGAIIYTGLSLAAIVLSVAGYAICKISRMNFENEPFNIQK